MRSPARPIHLGKGAKYNKIRIFANKLHAIWKVLPFIKLAISLVNYDDLPSVYSIEKLRNLSFIPIRSCRIIRTYIKSIFVLSSICLSIPSSSNVKSFKGTSLASKPENVATHSYTENVFVCCNDVISFLTKCLDDECDNLICPVSKITNCVYVKTSRKFVTHIKGIAAWYKDA